MLSDLPILMLFAAQSAAAPAADPPAPAGATSVQPCRTDFPKGDEQEIVICVERSQGYRIDPDLREAERQARRRKLSRPERFADKSCATVGPMGCRGGGGINLLAAAATAAEMAKRAVSGENVGEMFITEPEPDEYQLYVQARREREARKAAEAAAVTAEAEARAKAAGE